MKEVEAYEVIIIGGNYAGASAAMSLGRALRKVLIIDAGVPCNRQTPHAHNFLTHDGKTPREIAQEAREQLSKYKTVTWLNDYATGVKKKKNNFEIITQSNQVFMAKKIVIATGIKDEFPDIPGFKECWGISILHCPYCHGYEVQGLPTGILGNGDAGFDFSKLIHPWTKNITLLTNGKAILSEFQLLKLTQHQIFIREEEIDKIVHTVRKMNQVIFKDGTGMHLSAIYSRIPFSQQNQVIGSLGCILNEQGLIKIDGMQNTSIPGVYACGDNCSPMRSIANAVASGSFTGAVVNKDLIEEAF